MATKLIDMKLPKRKKDKGEEVPISTIDREEYPYGLKMRFEKEQIDKIDSLQKIEAGAKVSIYATGKVIEVSVNDAAEGRKRHTVTIQIQEVEVANKAGFKESFKEATEK